MKSFKKIFLIFGVLCSMLLTATACNTTNGIVESYKIEEQYIKIQLTEQMDNLYCYPSVFIYSSYFEKYSCNKLDELLNNEDFSSGLRSDWTLLAKSGEALAPSTRLNIDNDKCRYLLVYEGVEYNGDSLPDSFFEIKDATKYIGSIKF